MSALHAFPGGLCLPANKERSTALPIQQAPLAQRYIVPLGQHIGAPARPCVEVGQAVLKGQTIALPDGTVSAALHAPTSGTVVAIGAHPYPHASGLPAPAIVIASDGLERWTELHPCPDFRAESPLALLERIRAAGIGGLGGAGFPTAAKLAARPAEKIHTLVVNGAECEPYISADDLLMRERATQVLGGIDILVQILCPEEVLVGIEDDKPEAIAALGAALGERPYRIVALPTRYPSGGERQLIQLLTGREVPADGLPADIGILCQNVGTLAAVHDAVVLGRPLISRITTLAGGALERPMNVEALIGTPVHELLAFAGLAEGRLERVLMGGPMMGFALPDLSVPLIKTCNCLLAGDATELPEPVPAMPCIRCGDCAQVCPVSLLPQQLHFFALGDEHEQLLAHNLFDCIECGACAYVCPSSIPLVQYYRASKAEIREQRQKLLKAEQSRERFEQRQARLRRDEERRAAERAQRAEKAALARAAQAEREEAAPATAVDPVQAAIERARARKQAGSGSERLKRLKIEASMARVALKKAEKQLLSHDTPEQHGLVAELRAAAEAADKALADAEASLPRDLPSAPPAALDDEAELKKAKAQAAMARAQLKRSEKAFGEAPGAEQRATLDELRAEVERCEATLARLERHAPKPAAPGDDGQAALKRAKIALVGKRAALKKAEQAGVMDSELERLRGELQAAERDLHAAEDACGKPAPELVRIDKRPVDPRTRELKTELAYARAALKKLERLANADAAALAHEGAETLAAVGQRTGHAIQRALRVHHATEQVHVLVQFLRQVEFHHQVGPIVGGRLAQVLHHLLRVGRVVDDHEGRDEVELLARQRIGIADLEAHPVADPRSLGVRPRAFDGRRVEVTAIDLGFGERLGHHDRGQPAAAAEIEHAATRLELFLDAIQRRNPVLHEEVLVPGHGHALHAFPGFQREGFLGATAAAAEGLDDLRRHAHEGHAQLDDPAGEIRRVLVGEHRDELGREPIAPALRIVGQVVAGDHAAQPFAQVAGGVAGLLRQLLQGHPLAMGERLEQPQAVADVEHRAAQGIAVVLHDPR